jgi:exodeoxyribonuclease VII small subunit
MTEKDMKETSDKPLSYQAAMDEIERIIAVIENDQPDIDELAHLVKRAAALVQQCKAKLKSTGQELDEVLNAFDD